MCGCGRTSRPVPGASFMGPISSRNTNGPIMRCSIEGSARRTFTPSPSSRTAAESHTAAIERIESIAREENIGCDFARVDGYLFLAEGDSADTLDKELAAAHRAGLRGVTRIERAPFGSFDSGPCLRFPDQGQFHPLMYLAGLMQALHRHG